MKNLIRIILVACSLFMVSCDFFGESESSDVNKETEKIAVLPNAVKEHMIKQDTLNKQLLERVDDLTLKLNETRDSVAQLKATVKKLESPTPSGFWHFITLVALAISVITLLLSFRSRGLNRKEVQKEFSDCLDSSTRISGLKTELEVLQKKMSSVNNYQPKSKGGSTSKTSDLEAKVAYHEKKLKEVFDAVNRIISNNNGYNSTPSTPKEDKYSKVIYAKINTDKYFTDIVNSNQEACVFVINLNNDKKGEFDLISLDKIKSRNGWQDVVEYTGSCLMSEATSYTVQDKGICEKIDNNTWEVKRKLKIKISK